LQQNFIPAEAFGGPAGSFREVTLGQQYNTLFSFQPQFDIINMSNIAQIKAAKINMMLTQSQNDLNTFALHQNVNVTYHNILSFQKQKKILLENLAAAEKIKNVVNNRFEEGITRKQELNEAEVNVISLKDKLEQLDLNLDIQKQILSLFFENNVIPEISEDLSEDVFDESQTPEKNTLAYRNVVLQSSFLRQDIRSLQYQYYPTLSFTSSFNWQSLSNDNFFADNSSNIRYNFVGLKLSWDFPTVQRLSTIKNKQYQLSALQNQEAKTKNEAETQFRQLSLEYEKAQKQWRNYQTITLLKKDTYDKNVEQFQENILSLDRLLISLNDLLLAQINEGNALTNLSFTKHKILIHNVYK
jgi:OMF family outer membrane factor